MPVFFSNSYGRHQHEARSGVWLMRGIALVLPGPATNGLLAAHLRMPALVRAFLIRAAITSSVSPAARNRPT